MVGHTSSWPLGLSSMRLCRSANCIMFCTIPQLPLAGYSTPSGATAHYLAGCSTPSGATAHVWYHSPSTSPIHSVILQLSSHCQSSVSDFDNKERILDQKAAVSTHRHPMIHLQRRSQQLICHNSCCLRGAAALSGCQGTALCRHAIWIAQTALW